MNRAGQGGLPSTGPTDQLKTLASQGNRATGTLTFDTNSQPRTEIPLAFALQLTAKASEPTLPQVSADGTDAAPKTPPKTDSNSSVSQSSLVSSGSQEIAITPVRGSGSAFDLAVIRSSVRPVDLTDQSTAPLSPLVNDAGQPATDTQQAESDAIALSTPQINTEALGPDQTSMSPTASFMDLIGQSTLLPNLVMDDARASATDAPQPDPDEAAPSIPNVFFEAPEIDTEVVARDRRSETVANDNVSPDLPGEATLMSDFRAPASPAPAVLSPFSDAASSSFSGARIGPAEVQTTNGATAAAWTRDNGTGTMLETVDKHPADELATTSARAMKNESGSQTESAEKDQPAEETQSSANAQMPARTQTKDARDDSDDQANASSRSGAQWETTRASNVPIPVAAGSPSTHESVREPDRVPLPAGAVLDAAPRDTTHLAPAREIALKFEGAGLPNVSVQLSERAGKIEVAVRTGDSQLNRSLQSGLGDLVSELETHGFKTDAWTLGTARGTAMVHSSSEPAPNQQPPENSGSGHSKHEQQNESGTRRQRRANVAFDTTLAEEDDQDGMK